MAIYCFMEPFAPLLEHYDVCVCVCVYVCVCLIRQLGTPRCVAVILGDDDNLI